MVSLHFIVLLPAAAFHPFKKVSAPLIHITVIQIRPKVNNRLREFDCVLVFEYPPESATGWQMMEIYSI